VRQVASRIVRPVLRAAGMPDGVADAPERPAGPETETEAA